MSIANHREAMIEWSDRNKYNSFSSYKGLTYFDHYKKILGWMDGKNELPPPIECNLDPFAGCNLSCYFCITQRYLKTHPEEVGPMRVLPTEYMYRLVDFLVSWGVRGLCISGGGEPTLHKGVPGLPQYAVGKGMKAAIFTNGTNMDEAIADSLLACQFVSLSVNAATGATYERIMGVDHLHRVDKNMKYLVSRKGTSKTFLCVRTLVLPENYREIHAICKWAKDTGLGGFNVRPVDFERSDIVGHRKLEIDVEAVTEQFAMCREEETPDFRVFTVTHKFDDCFHVKHDFGECLAPPLLIPILQDGNAYLCVDKKMEADYKLGSCFPNPEKILDWWGGEHHRQLMKSVAISKCSRCTFGQYNRQIETVARDDGMFTSFP